MVNFGGKARFDDFSDEQIVELAKTNINKALEILLLRYDSVIRKIIRKYIFSGSDDLYQVGAMGLLSAVNNFNGASKFESFAYTCINNAIRSELRKNNSKKNAPLIDYVPLSGYGDGDSDKTEIIIDVNLGPEATYLDKEKKQEIEFLIKDTLSQLEYKILALFLQEYTYAEIGNKVNKSEKAVDNALQRIRKKLRLKLSEK